MSTALASGSATSLMRLRRAWVTLRGKVEWIDPNRRALGFREHHPVENLGRDGYRSQANRRVEVLLFDAGEEPDPDLAGGDPEVSAVYLPGSMSGSIWGRC